MADSESIAGMLKVKYLYLPA